MRAIWSGIAAAGLALAAAGALAALSEKDREFVDKAAADGLAEVELGKMASRKAASPQVKQFAERMVKDHSKANDELKKLAKAQGVTVPAKLEDKHAKLRDKLAKLSGREFDEEYMQAMRDDHDKAVELFKKQAEEGQDPALKKFASDKLATLHAHKQQADAKPEKTAQK